VQVNRESLIKLASLGGAALVTTVVHASGSGEAAGLLGPALVLLGSVAHASFGHLGQEYVRDLAKHFGGSESAGGRGNRDLHRVIGETEHRGMFRPIDRSESIAVAFSKSPD
jgi:hypothetical protein